MFQLTEPLLTKGKILDVAVGASSFTAECIKRGYDVMDLDPRYALSSKKISEFGLKELETAEEKIRKHQKRIGSAM
ncbi:hypothetical protein [Halalkalibacter urbisdiaboli]|uniref:hypothetical protein n=1 Tax=Halalkalibacter urbisdiaboli TaxID=1960589 RepID=UPI001FD89117|nr:hypothetical protein [Halalkalibacter urbisdiaboli]